MSHGISSRTQAELPKAALVGQVPLVSAPLAAGYTYSLSSTDTSLRLTLTGCALASREAIHSAVLLCRGAVLACY